MVERAGVGTWSILTLKSIQQSGKEVELAAEYLSLDQGDVRAGGRNLKRVWMVFNIVHRDGVTEGEVIEEIGQ